MKRSKILTLIAALALLAVPVAVFAGHGGGPEGGKHGFMGRGHGPAGHLLPPPGYLDLTEEQREAARAIHEKIRESLAGDREEAHALHQQLREALSAENPDPTEVGRLVIDLHGRRDGFRAARQAAEAEFEALLTPEQLEKWENWKELRESRRGPRGRFGRGPHGHGVGGHGFGHGFGAQAPEEPGL